MAPKVSFGFLEGGKEQRKRQGQNSKKEGKSKGKSKGIDAFLEQSSV